MGHEYELPYMFFFIVTLVHNSKINVFFMYGLSVDGFVKNSKI